MIKKYYKENLVSGKSCFIKGLNPKTNRYSAVGYAASCNTYSFTSKIVLFDTEEEAKTSDLWNWLENDKREPIVAKNNSLIDEKLKNFNTKRKINESWDNLYDKATDFAIAALAVGASKKTAQSFFDNAWNKEIEDSDDWILESKKSDKKDIKETTHREDYAFDFEFLNDEFYANYWKNDTKGFICVDYKDDDVVVDSHFEEGDYDDSEAGGLAPGWYGRGYEIDNIVVDKDFIGEEYYDEDDNEISKEEFQILNNFSDEDLQVFVDEAKDLLISEIEYYINEDPRGWID